MANLLDNIPEDFLYSLLPPGVTDLDARGLMKGLMAGIQDCVQDLRAYTGTYPDLVNPLATPLQVVQVIYTQEDGRVQAVNLNVTETTPDDAADLVNWAAAQMDIDPTQISSAVVGTDALRQVSANTLAYLAATLGATLYPGLPGEDPDVTYARQQLAVATYFPRLRIKGTPASFTSLAKLAGFDDAVLVPLWSRISLRDPSDPSSANNLVDLRADPDYYPTAVLPDEIYDPQDFTDGPFYRWTSRPLSTDPESGNYYLSAVNGVNPFINLNLIASGTVNHPDAGAYALLGGAPGVYAQTVLDAGTTFTNMWASAIGPGAAFNNLAVTVTGTGTVRTLSILGQLSTIKYRSSLFDAKVWSSRAGTLGVVSNRNLAANPSLVGDGVAAAPYFPWSGGQVPNANVTLWPERSVTPSAAPTTARVQAAGTTPQLDDAALQAAGAQAFDFLDEVRAATRLPRTRGVGLLTRDAIQLAPYLGHTNMLIPGMTGLISGGGTTYLGAVTSTPLAPFTADFVNVTSAGTVGLVSEVDAAGSILTFAGPSISSGTYNLSTGTWKAVVDVTFNGTIRANWGVSGDDVIRPEPAGIVAYRQLPEGTIDTPPWSLIHDDTNSFIPGIRLVAGGSPVNLDTFDPVDTDAAALAAPAEPFALDETGMPRRIRVVDIPGEPAPYRVKVLQVPSPLPIPVNFVSAGTSSGSDGEQFPVTLVDRQLVSTAAWSPARKSSIMSWWPLTEHSTDKLVVRDVIRQVDVPTIGINPEDRAYDTTRGWQLQLNSGGTVLAPINGVATTSYSYSLWSTALSGGTHTAPERFFQYGPSRLEVATTGTQLGVRLSIDGSVGHTYSTDLLNLDTNPSFIRAVVDQGTATLGVVGSVASSATLSGTFAVAGSTAQYGLTGAWRSLKVSDVTVWSTAKTTDELEYVRRPTLAPAAYGTAPYVMSVSDDHYSLQLLPESNWVVPRAANPGYQPASRRGSVVRYNGAGEFEGDDQFKLVGLGDAQIVPPVMRLGTRGPTLLSTGNVVVAGTNPYIPGFTTAWQGTSYSSLYYGLAAPYSSSGGSLTSFATIHGAGTTNYWPGLIPNYNGVVDRIYVQGAGTVYEIHLGDVGNGPQFIAQAVRRERSDEEVAIVGELLRYKDAPTDALTSDGADIEGLLADALDVGIVDSLGRPIAYLISSAFQFSLVNGIPVVVNFNSPLAVPPYMYKHSRLNTYVTDANTTWTNSNAYGRSVGAPALDSNGTLIFNNVGSVDAGNQVISFDVGNIGTVDDDFAGFNVEVTIVGGNNVPVIVDGVLLPDGRGTNPRGFSTLKFNLPYAITGGWTMSVTWTNDHDVPSRGQERRLVVYAYALNTVQTDLYRVNTNPFSLDLIDTYNSMTLAPGAWVASYNSYGSVAAYSHEANLRSNGGFYPLANTLTGSTYGRFEELQVTNPSTASNAAPLGAIAPIYLNLSPTAPYLNVGNTLTATVSGGSGAVEPVRYVWYLWTSGTVATSSGTTAARIDQGGTALPISVMAVDAYGRTVRASGTVCVNYPPNIDLVTATINNEPAPYDTDLRATISDPEGDAYTVKWFSSGTQIATGTTVTGYRVTSPSILTALAYDTRGGTNSADLYLGTLPNNPPIVSISSVPAKPKAKWPQTLGFSAIMYDPNSRPMTAQWTFWDSTTAAGALEPMNYFGGGTYNRVQRAVTGTSLDDTDQTGTKIVSVKVTNSDGLSATAGATVEFITNSAPVLKTYTVSSEPGVAQGTPLYYKASAYDPDGDTVNYEWTFPTLNNLKLYGASVTLDTGPIQAGTTVTAQLRVYDDFGGATYATLPTVTVAASALSPIVISPAGGVTPQGQVVTITSPDPGVVIRFTKDGTPPTTPEDGDPYTGPIMVNEPTQIQARAFPAPGPGGNYGVGEPPAPSSLATASFDFFNPIDWDLTRMLPGLPPPDTTNFK